MSRAEHTITCIRCGCGATRLKTASVMCWPCSLEHSREGQKAISRISAAVKGGHLPRAASRNCVDCGKTATEYDHRDYLKPLDVVPVCRPCNHLRGPALDSVLRSIPAKA